MHTRQGRMADGFTGWIFAMAAAAVLAAGCGKSPTDDLGVGPQVDVKPELSTSDAVLKQPVTPAAAPEAEPFDPPPLADLDEKATWIDRPVKDGLVLLRAAQAEEEVLCSVADALALRNDSVENNAKILSALGRLPGDGEADMEARIDRHVTGDLGSTNPIMISTSAEFDILGLTGFGLFSFGRDLEPFASAETVVSWQTSASHAPPGRESPLPTPARPRCGETAEPEAPPAWHGHS